MFSKFVRKLAVALIVTLSVISYGHQLVLAADNFAVFAYSQKTGKFGVSYNYKDNDKARKRALEECKTKSKSKDCKEVLTLGYNKCGALAISLSDPSLYDVGSQSYKWFSGFDEAKKIAVENCNTKTGKRNCAVFLTVCQSNETKIEYVDCMKQLTSVVHTHKDGFSGECYYRDCTFATYYFPIRSTADGYTKLQKKVYNCGLVE